MLSKRSDYNQILKDLSGWWDKLPDEAKYGIGGAGLGLGVGALAGKPIAGALLGGGGGLLASYLAGKYGNNLNFGPNVAAGNATAIGMGNKVDDITSDSLESNTGNVANLDPIQPSAFVTQGATPGVLNSNQYPAALMRTKAIRVGDGVERTNLEVHPSGKELLYPGVKAKAGPSPFLPTGRQQGSYVTGPNGVPTFIPGR
jgi:hypothetical protein